MTVPPKDILWTADDAAQATNGSNTGRWQASGVSIDSRTVAKGDLFIALKGPKFDGHRFVAKAGLAAAALVDHPIEGVGLPQLVVADTFKALNDLALAARARSQARIIAVTGSVGKTGIKEALKLVLSRQGITSANEGSLNNQWGLPLSLARMSRDAAFGIFEMGMNHPGEIEPLSRLARPQVAVITTVESVHGKFFDSMEAIADAKAEIFTGMKQGGVVVLNRDNPHFDRLATAARACGASTIFDFGAHKAAAVRLVQYSRESGGACVMADIAGQSLVYHITIPGRHWVMNSLAVLASVAAAGADVQAAADTLRYLKAHKGRGKSYMIRMSSGRFELIDDSYNASPVSMEAAFEVLGQARLGVNGRRIAVVGDMLELGPDSLAVHAGLAKPLEHHGADLVFTAGRRMNALWDALPKKMRGGRAATSGELTPMVLAAVRPGDVVTVKGSLGSRMGVIVKALRALDEDIAPPRQAVNGA